MRWFRRRQQRPGEAEQTAAAEREAARHYQQGNRLYESQAPEQALSEWRRAARLWQAAMRGGARPVLQRFLQLRAALGLLLTVLLVYNVMFQFFPRDSFELFMMQFGAQSRQEEQSWWDRFLNTGRPRGSQGHKMGMREWWRRFEQRMFGQQDGQRGREGQEGGSPPGIEERWAELLQRYGRWGPLFNYNLDYNIVSGYGLSRLNDYEGAVQAFREGIRGADEPGRLADLYQGLANTHYNEGYRLQKDGLATYDLNQVRKATDAYEKSLEYEQRPLSYGNLGWMYFLLGKYDTAVDYSQQALRMDAGLEYVRLNLGLTYLMQNRTREAFDAYRQVLETNPRDEVYLGGINDLREVIRDNPGRYPHAHLYVGLLAIKSGDITLGRHHLSRFVASPEVSQSWRDLARQVLGDLDTEPAVEED